MKINLNEIRSKLESNLDALVKRQYLNEDMELLYQYYASESDIPPKLKSYFDENESFSLLEFTKCYLEDFMNRSIKLDDSDYDLVRIIPE